MILIGLATLLGVTGMGLYAYLRRVDRSAVVLGQRGQAAAVVIGDAFGHLVVPWHLTTHEFVADIRRVLRRIAWCVRWSNLIVNFPKRKELTELKAPE